MSTFAGCGGSSLGYKQAGCKVVASIEWNKSAAKTYQANFPNTPLVVGDITNWSVDDCLKLSGLKVGELDILDGSPPCQGFSTAGKRVIDDERNNLFFEYTRLLNGLKPRAFVAENVSGMVKGKMRSVFRCVIEELVGCGYQVKAWMLNTKNYGVAQSRRRVFFVGFREDLGITPTPPVGSTKTIAMGKVLDGISGGPERLTSIARRYWPLLRPGESASKYHPKGHWFGLIKCDPNKPCPTIISGGMRLVHWSERRYLGPLELSALSSFPKDFKFPCSNLDTIKQIGNCVPPKMTEAIARHVCSLLSIEAQVSHV